MYRSEPAQVFCWGDPDRHFSQFKSSAEKRSITKTSRYSESYMCMIDEKCVYVVDSEHCFVWQSYNMSTPRKAQRSIIRVLGPSLDGKSFSQGVIPVQVVAYHMGLAQSFMQAACTSFRKTGRKVQIFNGASIMHGLNAWTTIG